MVAAIVGVATMLLLLSMPTQRENARQVACQRNLGQIGLALLAYGDAFAGALPPVATPLPSEPSPISAWLRVLGEPDFARVVPDRPPQWNLDGPNVVAHRVPGLLCPSDPGIGNLAMVAPSSYRFNAGDSPIGLNGPFAPGVFRTLSAIDEADGRAFTAAMAERLLGDGRAAASPSNYRRLAVPISSEHCPDEGDWKGDAGSSWATNGWETNLYTHALTPNPEKSCVSGDGQAGLIGSSSGHAGRVYVLLLDGGVRPYTESVHPRIWRALGTVGVRPAEVGESP